MRLFTVTSEITYDVFAETFKEAIELVHEAFVHDDSVYEWIDWDCEISRDIELCQDDSINPINASWDDESNQWILHTENPTPDFNGWRNYETWSVATALSNDEALYRLVVTTTEFPYRIFAVQRLVYQSSTTSDGVVWLDSCLDWDALDELLVELRA